MAFPAVAAMIRLGRKYDIPHLRDEGLTRLKLEYPSELEDFDKLNLEGNPHVVYHAKVPVEYHAISLAHECNIQR